MKTFRVWMLVLLAVLLPVRGGVAAAMLCPPIGTPSTAGHAAHGEMSHTSAHDHAAMSGHDTAQQAAHHAAGTDKCGLCCDLCSITPLLNDLAAAPMSQPVSAVSFPGFLAPAPSFLSSGPERPPRTI